MSTTSIWYISWGDRLIGEKRVYGAPGYLGKRFFRRLSDAALLSWRSGNEDWFVRSVNNSHANREYRRRAKRAGFSNVYDWMRANQ